MALDAPWTFILDYVVLQLDVANAFNLVSRGVIFQELYATCGDIIQIIPFVRAFYAFKSPLFYSHCNHEGDVTTSHLSWRFVKVILGGDTICFNPF
jgi:hypothetical protein